MNETFQIIINFCQINDEMYDIFLIGAIENIILTHYCVQERP